MTQYVPIKILCQQTGLCEKTIRGLIRKHGLACHRNSERGKILVSTEDFENYMRSIRIAVRKDTFVTDILREFSKVVR